MLVCSSPDGRVACFCFQVLGDYNRQNKSTAEVQKFIKEIASISSPPLHDHFFNVSDEVALLTIVDALGSKIFALEGIRIKFQLVNYSAVEVLVDGS